MSRIAFLTRVLAFPTLCRRVDRAGPRPPVLLNEVEAFHQNEQLVVSVIPQLEKLLDLGPEAVAERVPVASCFSPTNSPMP